MFGARLILRRRGRLSYGVRLLIPVNEPRRVTRTVSVPRDGALPVCIGCLRLLPGWGVPCECGGRANNCGGTR